MIQGMILVGYKIHAFTRSDRRCSDSLGRSSAEVSIQARDLRMIGGVCFRLVYSNDRPRMALLGRFKFDNQQTNSHNTFRAARVTYLTELSKETDVVHARGVCAL